MKKLTLGLLVLLGMVMAAGTLIPAWCQEVTGAIVGTVTDPSGAAIKGATVIATDIERGTAWTAVTNDTGLYDLARRWKSVGPLRFCKRRVRK